MAKANERTTVIHVETDPLIYAPDSQSWWDVPVSQVSALESTQSGLRDLRRVEESSAPAASAPLTPEKDSEYPDEHHPRRLSA